MVRRCRLRLDEVTGSEEEAAGWLPDSATRNLTRNATRERLNSFSFRLFFEQLLGCLIGRGSPLLNVSPSEAKRHGPGAFCSLSPLPPLPVEANVSLLLQELSF